MCWWPGAVSEPWTLLSGAFPFLLTHISGEKVSVDVRGTTSVSVVKVRRARTDTHLPMAIERARVLARVASGSTRWFLKIPQHFLFLRGVSLITRMKERSLTYIMTLANVCACVVDGCWLQVLPRTESNVCEKSAGNFCQFTLGTGNYITSKRKKRSFLCLHERESGSWGAAPTVMLLLSLWSRKRGNERKSKPTLTNDETFESTCSKWDSRLPEQLKSAHINRQQQCSN